MSGPSNELMYEVLKSVQTDVSELKEMRGEMREGFASIKGYLASFLKDQSILETRISELEAEMDRVKRRLELAD